MAQGSYNRADGALTLAVSLAGFLLYAKTAAPSVLPADSGEFQFVPYIAGIAHPTGYPLYCILGWAWTHLLPFGNVAYRMNLLSATFGALTLALLYRAALLFLDLAGSPPGLAQRLLALLATFLFGASYTFWMQATVAEVYALNAAFVAGTLYIALRLWHTIIAGEDTSRPLISLACVYGLSLTHHRTMLLMAPSLFALGLLSARRQHLSLQRVLRLTLPGLLLPQLLYLYIPLRAPYTPYAQITLDATHTLTLYPNTLQGFLGLVLGSAFRGDLASGTIGSERLLMALDLLRQQFTWGGIALGILGLIGATLRRAWIPLLLTLGPYITYVGFNLLYFIGDIQVLFTPTYLFFALWIGFGTSLVSEVTSRWPTRQKIPASVSGVLAQGPGSAVGRKPFDAASVAAIAFILPIHLFTSNLMSISTHTRAEATETAATWAHIFAQPLPQNAILISNDRDEMMPMWYFQYVDQRRPDLLGLFPIIIREPGYADLGEVIDRALASGRPTYLIKSMPGLEVKYELSSEGTLTRVMRSYHERRPRHKLDLQIAQTLRTIGFDLSSTHLSAKQELTVTIYWQVLQKMEHVYSSFVRLVNARGQVIASEDHRPGGDYYPTTLWKPDEVLLDVHKLKVPADCAAGNYSIVTGLYEWPSMQRLGTDLVLGNVTDFIRMQEGLK